jgi:hypothetical protein
MYWVSQWDLTIFIVQLLVSEWSGGTSNDLYTFLYVCSLVSVQNRPVNQCSLTMRTFFETKRVVQTQRHFCIDFHVLSTYI